MHKDKPKKHMEPRPGQFRLWEFVTTELVEVNGEMVPFLVSRLVRDNVMIDAATGDRVLSPDSLIDCSVVYDYGRGKVKTYSRPLYTAFTYRGVDVKTSTRMVGKSCPGTRNFQLRDLEVAYMECERLMTSNAGRHYVRQIARSVENLCWPDRKLSVNVDALSLPFVIHCLRAWETYTWQTRSLARYADKVNFPDMLSPALVSRQVRISHGVEWIDGVDVYGTVWNDGVVTGLDGNDWNSAHGLRCRAIANAHRAKYANSVTLSPRGENMPIPKRDSRMASPFYTTSSNLPSNPVRLLDDLNDLRVCA